MKSHVAFLVGIGMAGAVLAEEAATRSALAHGELIEGAQVEVARTATAPAITPDCSGGVKYDDGGYETDFAIGLSPAAVTQRFDFPAGTTQLDQACICLSRDAGAPSSKGFDVVIYDNDGSGGGPGTFIGSVHATASSIPIRPSRDFYNVSLAGSGITLPDTSVYLGISYLGYQNNGDPKVYLCGDRSATTPSRDIRVNGYDLSVFITPEPRAAAIRADVVSAGGGGGGGGGSTCTPNGTTLCLTGNRFKVTATFQQSGGSVENAHLVELTDQTGYMWFFDSSNVEAVVKVIDGCGFNSRYWVFAGGLTNVRVVITVTDMQTGTVKTYTNPQGTPFAPIQDTSAMAVCP